jgi:hypothetical protein
MPGGQKIGQIAKMKKHQRVLPIYMITQNLDNIWLLHVAALGVMGLS